VKESLKYYLSLLVVVLIILLVGFSRVALGVHSLNQVLYGWLYGLWLAFFLFRFARPRLSAHIQALLDPQSALAQHYLSYYFHLALLLWATVIVSSIFNFLVARRDFPLPPPQLWLDNMLSKCNIHFNEVKMFICPAFIKMGLVSAPFGAYMGLLLDASLSGSPTPTDINNHQGTL
jgi:hypothetical protein